jgi:hypothetical protein
MSSIIRKLIAAPAPMARVEVVKWTDPETGEAHEITLSAENDAENVLDSMMLDDGKRNAFAMSYSATLKRKGVNSPVAPDMVPLIKLVHRSIAVADGEDPFDESDIAYLAKTHGDLFFMLLEASSRLGNLENVGAAFMEQQAGNSSAASTRAASRSTSGPSGQPGKSRRR